MTVGVACPTPACRATAPSLSSPGCVISCRAASMITARLRAASVRSDKTLPPLRLENGHFVRLAGSGQFVRFDSGG